MGNLSKVLLHAFLFLTNLTLQSQIMIGLKSGLNLNTVTVDTRNIDNTQSEFLPGFQIGAIADIGINSYFSIKSELLFSQKGYKIRRYLNADLLAQNNNTFSDTWSLTTNYFEMPILANFFYEGQRFKIFTNIGPYGAYWLSGQQNASIYANDLGDILQTPSQKNTSQNYAFDHEYGNNQKIDSRFDFGLAGGLGFGLKIKNGWLLLEGRYNLGLMDLITFQNKAPKTYQQQLNRNIAVTISYVIIIKPKTKKSPTQLDNPIDEEDSEN